MDLGGVRTDTASLPRIPMANLPGELAQQIHLMQQEGTKSMRLRIVPENLGELRIEIHGSGDSLRVKMIAASPIVRDALDSQMGELRQALQKQGLTLEHSQVDTGAPRDGSPQQREKTTYQSAPSAPAAPFPDDENGSREFASRPVFASGALNLLA